MERDKWGKVFCLRKKHDGRDWALNHRPSDLKSNALTTTPRRPHRGSNYRELIHTGCFECGLGMDMGGFESSFQSLKIHILSTVLDTFVWN